MFDNRTPIVRAGMPGLQKRLDDLRGLGRNHFCLQVGDLKLGYCYIRKNACSSFKKMFLDLSPPENARRPDERPIDFMRRYHRMSEQDLGQCDHLIFVYRDPKKRVLSMFRNKFIACTGAEDIHRHYERSENRKPEDTSFRDFVQSYLHKSFKTLDRHVLPQKMHLRRAVYTDVIPMETLHAHMTGVLGADLADKYFRRPVNRTSDIPLRPLPDAAERPIKEIRQIFLDQNFMPDDASLLPADLDALLTARYDMDYDIIRQVSGLASAS
jgi:hypothetical protein